MPEIECRNCGWQGAFLQRLSGLLCPDCGQDEFKDLEVDRDSVGPDDYEEQERNSSWK